MGPLPLGPQDPRSVGPYELLARLGSGGMGQVYLARQEPGAQPVAVKVVRSDYAREHDFRPRFRAEVTAARSVRSPYVVPLIDADPEAELPWLATEYVRGVALREAVGGCGPLPEPAVRLLGAGLAEALTAIHAAGLAHRDLTPGNVLLTRQGPQVIDFGIARAAGAPALTRTGVVIGTPGYIPPEQAAGFRAGPAGDVFALGSALVFAATGTGPYGDSTALTRMLARIARRGPDLRTVPEGLRSALTAALSRDPADRPTARELSELLAPSAEFPDDWLPGPVLALLERQLAEADRYLGPPSRPRGWGAGRTGGWSRRTLLLAGAAGTVAAGAAGAAGWAALRRPRPPAPAPPPRALTQRWRFHALSRQFDFAPAPLDQLVLCADGDRLVALSAAAGVTQWSHQAERPVVDPASVGRLAVALTGGTVLCLNSADGSLNWQVEPPATGAGRITPDTILFANDHAVFTGGPVAPTGASGLSVQYGRLALSLASKDPLWVLTEPIDPVGRIDAPASDFLGRSQTGALLFAENTGRLVVRSPSDGSELWSYQATAPAQRTSWATADIGQLYLPTGQDELTLQALGSGDGRELWTVAPESAGSGRWTPAAVAGDLVLAGHGQSLVSAFDSLTGERLWSCPLPGQPADARPVVLRGTLFVPGTQDRLFAVDLGRRRVGGIFTASSRFGSGWQLDTDGNQLYARYGPDLYALDPL